MAELQARYAQIDDELMPALERWEALGSALTGVAVRGCCAGRAAFGWPPGACG